MKAQCCWFNPIMSLKFISQKKKKKIENRAYIEDASIKITPSLAAIVIQVTGNTWMGPCVPLTEGTSHMPAL